MTTCLKRAVYVCVCEGTERDDAGRKETEMDKMAATEKVANVPCESESGQDESQPEEQKNSVMQRLQEQENKDETTWLESTSQRSLETHCI